MPLFQDKFRVETTRLKHWDYAQNGYYFVTVCTKNQECIFGEIIEGSMVLSEIGKIVKAEWLKSFEIRQELFCDEYCIMPNHIHAIVIIENDDVDDAIINKPYNSTSDCVSTSPVETHGRASLQQHALRALPPKYIPKRSPKSVSSFIAGFKSSATKRINEFRQTPQEPVWQPRFYDRIIHTPQDLDRVRRYIQLNPENGMNEKIENEIEFGESL